MVLFALLSIMTNFASAQNTDREIWGKALMPEALDKEPFRPIKVPEWMVDNPGYLAGTDWQLPTSTGLRDALDEAKAAGAQMDEMVFLWPESTLYDSKYVKRDPKHPADLLDKKIAALKKRGIKIIAHGVPCLLAPIYYEHPEWRLIATNTTEIPSLDPKTNPYGGYLCQMGPWGDRLIDIIVECAKKYPRIDGFTFDGIHHFGPCYCQFCRQAYLKDTGKQIPNFDMNDPEYRHYLVWEDRRFESFIQRMQTRMKAVNPNLALVSWTTNAGRFPQLKAIPHELSARTNTLMDAPCQEFWMEETNRGNSVVPAFSNACLWATSNHRVAFTDPYLMSHGNPYGTDSFPSQEYLRRALLVITHGPYVRLAVVWKNLREASLDTMREVMSRAPWFTNKEVEPWAALVMGDYTRNFYGRSPEEVEERYLGNVYGAYRAALEEHLPLTVINEWNLNKEDLARYKVLILANTACISDAQAEAIREFVKNGGGLVATVESSRFDEFGTARKDFALADVFGTHYEGLPAPDSGSKAEIDMNFAKGIDETYWAKRKGIFNLQLGAHPMFDQPRLKDLLGGLPVTFKGQAVFTHPDVPTDQAASMTAVETTTQTAPAPAIIARTFGKGKVVYMAAGIDSAYYLYPYPYQRLVMAQAIRWAAGAEPMLEVEAPMCVQSTIFRQKKDGERLVVNLYNDLNSAGNHARPDEDVPLREEIIPLYNIGVTFKGYPITRAHLEPGAVELKITVEADKAKVIVPKLDIHCMIVAELGK